MSKESRQRLREQRISQDWSDVHQRHIEQHEQELQRVAERHSAELRDPNKLAALGLPANMPEESLRILGHAVACDKIGPSRPRADRYGDSLGNAPSVLHRFD